MKAIVYNKTHYEDIAIESLVRSYDHLCRKKLCKRKHLTSFQLIILGFAGVILLGSILLMLPVSSLEKVPTPFHEALFTATSAVCVTGLVVKDSGSYWSVFGQTVILALIQIGGLGVVTVAAAVSLLSGKKISLMQRSTMQDAISAPKVGGIVRLTRFILKGTLLIEAAGAMLLLPDFCIGLWLKGNLDGSLSFCFCFL